MIKDIISYNGKEYQLSTVNIDGCFETMVFPIEDGIVSGREVYACRLFNAGQSYDEHRDIYYHPEKYLSDEAIAEYKKSKYEDFEQEEKILFPCQFLIEFINGRMKWDDMIEHTTNEVDRLLNEYAEKHNLKT